MKTPAFTILFLFLAGVHSFPAARAESIPEAYNRGAFNQVIKAYLKLSDNNDLPATLNLATVFKDLGYHQRGIEVLLRARKRFADAPQVLKLLGRMYYLNSRMDEACAILEQLRAAAPLDQEVLITLGLCCLEKKDDARAQEYLRQAVALNKNNLLARLSLADLYYRRENLAEAVKEYKAINAIDASIQGIYAYWADILFRLGDYKAAFKAYDKLVALQPANKAARERLDLVRAQLGKDYFTRVRQEHLAERARTKVLVKPLPVVPGTRTVSVGLLETASEVEFTCSGEFTLSGRDAAKVLENGLAQQIYTLKAESGQQLRVTREGADPLIVEGPLTIAVKQPQSTITILNVAFGHETFWADAQDRSYRGTITVVAQEKRLRLLNTVTVEEYLYSVVPSEMPAKWPLEALKAQAIAARSEALAKLGRHRKEGFDFCAEVHCQAYAGVEWENQATNLAVDETWGMVLTYANKPIDAVYSGCCGGHTQNNIFGDGKPIAYFQGTPDAGAECGFSFPQSPWELDNWLKTPPQGIYCDLPEYAGNINYRWVRIYSAQEMDDVVRRNNSPARDVGRVKRILAVRRNVSGHVQTIKIVGDKTSCVIDKELEIRRALGDLRSSMFKVEMKLDTQGNPQQFVFYGGGWGHGVGMCQAGARGMAQSGKSYRDILEHYFPAAQLKKIY
ncbi:MAG TPA: SpoIID/LytB domain-containing protein [Candidatus Omnitrophota bacterium]|nr:SpoIID/LytB domain-containing protein [Candidatus Omnitrophota bacterium]HRZ14324.1 SpoIID/LytB domain-containing protein [Candidatus Omnitrophota bacterium]